MEDMKSMNIIELYRIKCRIIKEGMQDDPLMDEVLEAIDYNESLIENASATGGSGAGAVVSAQPSGLAGQTIGTSWASHGGTTGSGDISAPYNPGGSNRMSQKIPMGKNHGSRVGKKSRKKKIDMKSLKDMFSKRKKFKDDQDNKLKDKSKKVMSYNDFLKNDFTTIKK